LKIDKSVDNLSHRLDRIEEEEITEGDSSSKKNASNNTDPELEKLSPMERYILRFNWYVREIMHYYKVEVMQVHNIATDEEYTRRILEGDESIYLPQPNSKFESTSYKERIAAVLDLDYRALQQKISKGEIKDKIATNIGWRDEDRNAVF
jgi:hypothetical protein